MNVPKKFWLAVTLLFALGPVAGAQQASPASPSTAASPSAEKPKPAPAVWTNDNISAVRTPADDYLAQEEAQKEAAAAAAAKVAQPNAKTAPAASKSPSDDFQPPKTADEARKRLSDEQQQMDNVLNVIGKTKQQIANAPSAQVRAALEQELKLLGGDQQYVTTQIQKLQDALKAFPAKQPAPSPAQSQQ